MGTVELTVEDGAMPADSIGLLNIDSSGTELVGETALYGINYGVYSTNPMSVNKIIHRPPPLPLVPAPKPMAEGNRVARRGNKQKRKRGKKR
ncbi:hypothetical protein SAMN05421756_108170 [Microlunatus flavus]|uniref:Uncharacterized protein n=2 Tax=Microlunatus flavus TaxID=1036181 RepID=A0A1H9L6Z8_9ACTN|nr:hypothetical protein SAMN05421756_108170 [Microlunatus flavus]